MRYLDRVRTYFSTHLPGPLDESRCLDLADRIAERVEQIESELQQSALHPGMSYLDRRGTIETVRAQAEEVALAELLYSIPVAGDQDNDDRSANELMFDERAIDRRLMMDDESPEAVQWAKEYPHLVDRMKWITTDHAGETPQETSIQIARILDRENSPQTD